MYQLINDDAPLTDDALAGALETGLTPQRFTGKRVLVIMPDGTRSMPMPLMFRLLCEQIGAYAARLDFLVALGTHRPMSPEAIDQHVGMSAAERAVRFPATQIFNHDWGNPDTFFQPGVIPATDVAQITEGLMREDIPVALNKAILEYDHLLIVGPVFPHEVAGFSGGAKYLFPGIAAGAIINTTHWLGALSTSMHTIGVADTLVRRVLHRAAELVLALRPITLVALTLKGQNPHGIYIGDIFGAWRAAADHAARLNIRWVARPFRRVLAAPATMYEDLWTASKAMYKSEPAVADGGEVIIYAPHLATVSYSHGTLLEQIGYHVRDYFLAQPERFAGVPGSIRAHSTHVKGAGTYDHATGLETPRIQVTLATGIPEAVCRRINLGYVDYRTIEPEQWVGREDEGLLYIPRAGEVLYRVSATDRAQGRGL
jgi:nickel-dependent lactate racemase